MFESRTRPVNIPQMEHSRLAGALAAHWGNADFARPPIAFEAFVRGVTLHDWPYGPLDNAPLTRMRDEQWLSIQQRGLKPDPAHPIADLIAKMHSQRLLTWSGSHEARALMAQYDLAIEKLLSAHGLAHSTFQQIDTVTQFLDMIAFDFSFEEPTERTIAVQVSFGEGGETLPVHYAIEAGGRVTVSPWPFDVDRITGFVFGYQRKGYPDQLTPVMVTYRVEPGA